MREHCVASISFPANQDRELFRVKSTYLVFVRVLFDKGVNEGGGGGDDAHVLVVQQMDYAGRPLS